MKIRTTYLAAFAAFHVILVLCGAAHLQLISVNNLLGKSVATYAACSGADSSYGFFAPRVSPELKAEFVMTDADGQQWTDTTSFAKTKEAKLRFAASISMVSTDELRDGVAASWAAAMFGRHPRAVSVEMHVVFQDMPSMEQFREGARPRWQPMFDAKFERNDEPAVTDGDIAHQEIENEIDNATI